MGYPATHFSAATIAVTNRFVTSTAMAVGAYPLANGGAMPSAGARNITITHTTVAVTDTLGTVTVVGRNLAGQTISETITPVADGTATGTAWFASVTSVTGAGWAKQGASEDTLVVGCAAVVVAAEATGTLWAVCINTTAAGTVTVGDASGTIAVLKASIAEGVYRYNVTFSGYLTVALAAASDVTIVASGSLPTSYALA